MRMFVFFFQAEDGIRDYKVTGVQTCALPICSCRLPPSVQTERQAAVRKKPVGELILAGGQSDAALEAAIGNFEPVNDGARILNGKGTLAADDDRSGIEVDLQFDRRDAGKSDAQRQTNRRLL